MTTQSLNLNLELKQANVDFAVDDKVPLGITLSNQGSEPIRIVPRLGVGYENSLDREIYFSITIDDGTYDGYNDFRVDYNRPEVQDKDIQKLGPGESVSSQVDLQEWYRMTKPGTYVIRATYDVHEVESFSPATKPVVSGPISVTIR